MVPLPVTLTIPAIGVQTRLVHLGLAASGALQVPSTTAVAGWYTGSPRPGAIGPAVIAGHIDSHVGPGVFFRLSQLRPGRPGLRRRADGTLAVFRVTAVRSYAKDRFPTAAVYGPTPDAELRLITCGGTFDPQLGSYLSNTVVYAVQVSDGPSSHANRHRLARPFGRRFIGCDRFPGHLHNGRLSAGLASEPGEITVRGESKPRPFWRDLIFILNARG